MDEILKKIPHRPPFLFIDEIIEIKENGAICKRLVREDEPQFEGHYPGNPIMPGVLLCEACFQTAAIYIANKLEGQSINLDKVTPVLSKIVEAKFKQMVKPGDEIFIEVEFQQKLSKFYFLKGKVLKEEKIVLTIDFALAIVED